MNNDTPQVTYIRPANTWASVGLHEIWAYRELLYFLTWRDLKVRYKQAAIGIAWAILQPLVTTAIFTVIFSTFARFETGSIPYPLFALSGSMIWLYVYSTVTMASTGFTGNANLVTKVYFPRLIVPAAAALAGILDLLISFVILVTMMAYFKVGVTTNVIFAPLFIALALILTASVGTLFSALNVKYRDVKFVLPFVLQIWMIASPIFYPASLLTEKWRLAFAVNPLVGIMEGFRASVFGGEFDWRLIGVSCVSLVVIAIISLAVFKKMEDDFADLI